MPGFETAEDYEAAVLASSAALLETYRSLRPRIGLVRTLEECRANENLKLAELKRMYAAPLSGATFLKASYFDDFDAFARHQDIPARYFTSACPDYYFLSHRWNSLCDPDPEARQFRQFRSYFEQLPRSAREHLGFWYDYSCMPQADADGRRTLEEEAGFAANLKIMHLLTTLSRTAILFGDGHLDRSWCLAEWMFASNISPLVAGDAAWVPFGNVLKFRHVALLVLFLRLEPDLRTMLMEGNDHVAVAFINSLILKMFAGTKATYAGDKGYLLLILHRHFWHHLRFLGLRSQLLATFLILDGYGEPLLEGIFQHFLALSDDPAMTWTQEAAFEIDTMVVDHPDPFDGVTFHNSRIDVTSNSLSKSR